MKKINTRYGVLKVPVDDNDLIGRFLLHYGEWAWDEVTFVASVMSDCAKVLDIGACFGTFGIGLSQLRNLSKICFVDGNPDVIPCLVSNVECNVHIPYSVKEAIVGRPGMSVARVHAEPENIGSASFVVDEVGQLASSKAPSVRSLKEIWEEEGPFDLIKVDAEGMEISILDSYAQELAKGETTLWLECNEDQKSLALCDRLLSWGLDVYYFAFPSHNPDNFFGKTKSIFPFAYEAGLLVAPQNKPSLSEVLASHGCILKHVNSTETLRLALWQTPRWGYAGWEEKSVPEVVALAGHALRDENFPEFLRDGWRNKTPLTQVRVSLEAELARLSDEIEEQKSASRIALASAEKEKATLKQSIGDVEQCLLDQRALVAQLNDELLEMQMSLNEAASTQIEVQQRNKALTEKIAILTVEKFDQIAEVTRRYDAIKESDRKVEYVYVLANETGSSHIANAHYTEQLAFLRDKVRSMEVSTTWRLTAPLRSIISQYPTMHRAIRLARRIAAKVRDQYRRI
ncbi:FkbM family methyltransferase [Asaia lannensis]|uniref:FkbM family methyltransferase n=1 Tax=Asaia lannensis TaxID=415421 RepID=UPI003872F38A